MTAQELRSEHHEQHRDAQKIRHQEQHAVHRVPGGHDEHAKTEDDRREHVERNGFEQ